MSVKVNNWVWQDSPRDIDGNPFNGNPFTVLQALADIADDDGNVIYAEANSRTQEALAWKARVSLRTFQRSLVLLSDAGLVTVKLTGRENTYKINMSIPNEQYTRQTDVFITPGETPASLSTHVTGGGSGTPAVADHKDVLTKEDLNPSSLGLPTDAAALRADDEISSSQRLNPAAALRRAKARKHLDPDRLYDRVDQIFDELGPDFVRRPLIYQIALRILGKAAKAGTEPFDPTNYVAAAIELEPEVWRKVAFTLYARSS